MKSKSFEIRQSSTDTQKQNRSSDFVDKNTNAKSLINDAHGITSHKPPKRKKVDKRESIEMSHITIDGPGLNSSGAGSSTPMNDSKATATPLVKQKHQTKSSQVKSIMKNSSTVTDDAMDDSSINVSYPKPKKRNKSVSFMLGDNEEVSLNKKTKSNDSSANSKNDTVGKSQVKARKQFKKVKKEKLAEKENKIDVNQLNMDTDGIVDEKSFKKPKQGRTKSLQTTLDDSTGDSQTSQIENSNEVKKKDKKLKKIKKPDETESTNNSNIESTSEDVADKVKKSKKKKHHEKTNTEVESDEPSSKSRKKDTNPDVVSELENLSIGDNAHTLSNLLDDMLVVDKEKQKKLRRKFNKNKKPKGTKTEVDSDKIDDVQEKVKWSRRKWNKDGKVDHKEANLDTTVIVDNLPLSMLFTFKKVLAEHFAKYGLIKSIGIAEVYPTEESKPVFTTTITFYSDGAAKQAVDDSTVLEGSRVAVHRARPATETTLVARSYGALSPQALTSMFHGAGRLRNIRHLVKGKHSMSTYFVEFDGPESVEKALKLGADTKVGGKKVYLSRFELRPKKTKEKKDDGSDADDSEDSQE